MVLNKRSRCITITNFCLGKHLVCENDLLKDQRGSPAYISPDVLSGKFVIEPPHDKTNKMTCASIKNSDQPGHPPSLIRVLAVHMKKYGPLTTYWVHSEDSNQTGRMPKLIFAGHVILLVLLCGGSNVQALKMVLELFSRWSEIISLKGPKPFSLIIWNDYHCFFPLTV